MTTRTNLRAGAISLNHNEALQVRTGLKAGGKRLGNHNEALRVRSTLKAGGVVRNHNEALVVRTALRAGGVNLNHNEALQVRIALKAGGSSSQHNENLQRTSARPAVSMRRELVTASPKDDRLELLVVRAGLCAGRRARGRYDR